MTSHHEPSRSRRALTTAPELLERAASVVAARRGEYGVSKDLFERVAVRWSQVLRSTVTPPQVIICLIDLKIARLAHNPRHLDSITDIAGYAGCLAEVLSDA
jgi:hypothetical protein